MAKILLIYIKLIILLISINFSKEEGDIVEEFSLRVSSKELFQWILVNHSLYKTGRIDYDLTNYSTGASDRSFYSIFNKRFDHLETLLTTDWPKKVLSAGSLCGPLVPCPQSKCPKRTFMLAQKYQSHWNVSWKTKTNINFIGQTWVRPPAKCWVKGFILPRKYHASNFCRRFWHNLAI